MEEGEPKRIERQAESPFVLDEESFWQNLALLKKIKKDDDVVCVIGSGEAAASILVELTEQLPILVPILIINPEGTIHYRRESYCEDTPSIDPSDWRELHENDRKETIRCANSSSFSTVSALIMNGADIKLVTVDVKEISIEKDIYSGEEEIQVRGEYNGRSYTYSCKIVVVAEGFNA